MQRFGGQKLQHPPPPGWLWTGQSPCGTHCLGPRGGCLLVGGAVN